MDLQAFASLLQHRLLLFTGKGGVGKTTMVAAIAVHAARHGWRPLIVELSHRESMRAVFGVDDIGFKPRSVGYGVHAMSVDLDLAVLDYMMQHVPSQRIAKSIVQNKVLERLFKAMPAVGEIATINKLRQLESETQADGRRRWAPILVDLDATGHALMFLELRKTLEHILGTGSMSSLIESTARMLADPEISRLALVTTPDELPVTETIELYRRLQDAKTVAWGHVYVNRVPRTDLTPQEQASLPMLARAAHALGEDDVLADAMFAQQVLAERDRALAQIERLKAAVRLPVVELPRLSSVRMDEADLAFLGAIAATGGHA